MSRIDDPKDPKPGEYKLTRTYWVHSSTRAVKRRTITLQDHVGELWPVIILRNFNTGAEEDVKVEPHKNAKKSLQPFYATVTSPKQRISDKAKTPLGPSSIYDELYEEGGAIIDSASFAEIPKIETERPACKRYLIEKCKDSKGKFLHSLQVSP